MITSDELRALIARGEGSHLEFKRELPRGDVTSDIGGEMVAFANTEGGTIILGVDDDGTIVGLTGDIRQLEERIMGIARTCDPPLTPTVETMSAEGKQLLLVHVPQGVEVPYKVRDICYVRVGSTRQRASRKEEQRLYQEGGLISFERTPVREAIYEDLDEDKVRRYLEKRLPETVGVNERSLQEMLLHSELPFVVPREGRPVPTVAGLLLFGSHPQYFLPQAHVLATRFAGLDMDVAALDRDSFRGSVDQLIEQTTNFVRRNMRIASFVDEARLPYRTDVPEYPLRAVREAITNACLHRDYSLTGQDVRLSMFDDRLEVFSPGGLVRGMRVEDLGTGKHVARNPVLAQTLRDMGLIEKYGTGIRMIRREMKALGSEEPRFIVHKDSFTAILPARRLEIWQVRERRANIYRVQEV